MEDFVRAKREFQEQKVRYEKAILLKNKLERQCSVAKRSMHYARMEILRQSSVARKQELARKKKARVWYLMNKYGRKWLNIIVVSNLFF